MARKKRRQSAAAATAAAPQSAQSAKTTQSKTTQSKTTQSKTTQSTTAPPPVAVKVTTTATTAVKKPKTSTVQAHQQPSQDEQHDERESVAEDVMDTDEGEKPEGGEKEEEVSTGGKRKRKRHSKRKGANDGENYTGNIVFVEGIPWTSEESDVSEFFKGCGEIAEVRMTRWQDSGRSRGFAHVEFTDAKGAQAAFGLAGQSLGGRNISVRVPREPSTDRDRKKNCEAVQPAGCKKVFVKNLPFDTNDENVEEALSSFGTISTVRLATWARTGNLKGYGYIDFATEEGALACVRKQESIVIGNRPIVADFETGAPRDTNKKAGFSHRKKTTPADAQQEMATS